MPINLTDTEKAAPSKRLADNLEYFKGRLEDTPQLNAQQEACVGASVSHAGFCVESALLHLAHAMDAHPGLRTVKSYLEAALSEVKDAVFVLDGYHAWHEQNIAWEEEASEDLDTCGYAGKWKSAKEGVTRDKPALSGSAYWEAVRLYFLELGGCYLHERCEPAPAESAAPALPIIPGLPYQARQNWRFA